LALFFAPPVLGGIIFAVQADPEGRLAEVTNFLADSLSLTLKERNFGVLVFGEEAKFTVPPGPLESTFFVKWGARRWEEVNPKYSNPHLALEEARAKGVVILITDGRLDQNSLGQSPENYILAVQEAAKGMEVYVLLVNPSPEDKERWQDAFGERVFAIQSLYDYHPLQYFLNYFLSTHTFLERHLYLAPEGKPLMPVEVKAGERKEFEVALSPYDAPLADFAIFSALRTEPNIRITLPFPCVSEPHYLLCPSSNPYNRFTVVVEGGKEDGRVYFWLSYVPAKLQLQEPSPDDIFFTGEKVKVGVKLVGERGIVTDRAKVELIVSYPSRKVEKKKMSEAEDGYFGEVEASEAGKYWFVVEAEGPNGVPLSRLEGAFNVLPRPEVKEVRFEPDISKPIPVPATLRISAEVEHTGADRAFVFAQLRDERGTIVGGTELSPDPNFPHLYDGELRLETSGPYTLTVYLTASYGMDVAGPIERSFRVEAVKVRPEIEKVRFQLIGSEILVTVRVRWAEAASDLKAFAWFHGEEGKQELERTGEEEFSGRLPYKLGKVAVALQGTLKDGANFGLRRDYIVLLPPAWLKYFLGVLLAITMAAIGILLWRR
jgi:hypothetical protein